METPVPGFFSEHFGESIRQTSRYETVSLSTSDPRAAFRWEALGQMKVQRISRSITIALASIVLLGSSGVALAANASSSQNDAQVLRVRQARKTAISKRIQAARTNALKVSILKQRELHQIKLQRQAQRAVSARQARVTRAQSLERRARAERARNLAAQRAHVLGKRSQGSYGNTERIKSARTKHAQGAEGRRASERRVREARAKAIRADAARLKAVRAQATQAQSVSQARLSYEVRTLSRRYQAAQAQHQGLIARLQSYQNGDKSSTQISRAKRLVGERLTYLERLIESARAQLRD
jgi:hypothetical protein